MTHYQLADKIVAAFRAAPASRQKFVRTNYDPAWRLVCLIESRWVHEDGLTARGRGFVVALARELGIDP